MSGVAIFDQEVPVGLQRICVYGDPKTGKTPLVMQLPLGTAYWGEMLYFASDDGAETLRSTAPEMRKYIHTVKGAPDPDTGKYNPIVSAWEILRTDWRKQFPNVKTFVWDTMTETGDEILHHIADTNQFSEDKHIVIGAGTPYAHNITMQGDYGAAQGEMARLIKYFVRMPMHVIGVAHTRLKESKNGAVLAGGPGTVGSATIRDVAKPFDAVIRLESKMVADEATRTSEQRVVINTAPSGVFIGGVKMTGKNPIPVVTVPNNKPLAAFWPLYMDKFYPEVVREYQSQEA